MKIGIGGTIGSGKTTFVNFLRKEGLEVFDADKEVALLEKKGHKGYDLILKHFDDITLKDGSLDRQKLADIVFRDPFKLTLLNSLIHPLLKEVLIDKMKDKDLFIAEIPLLFETDFYELFDLKVLITCDEEVALKRLEGRGLDHDEALRRLKNQRPFVKIKDLADIIICNNDDIEDLALKARRFIKEAVYVGK